MHRRASARGHGGNLSLLAGTLRKNDNFGSSDLGSPTPTVDRRGAPGLLAVPAQAVVNTSEDASLRNATFAANIGGRMFGTSAAMITSQLANVMPGAGPAAKLALIEIIEDLRRAIA